MLFTDCQIQPAIYLLRARPLRVGLLQESTSRDCRDAEEGSSGCISAVKDGEK